MCKRVTLCPVFFVVCCCYPFISPFRAHDNIGCAVARSFLLRATYAHKHTHTYIHTYVHTYTQAAVGKEGKGVFWREFKSDKRRDTLVINPREDMNFRFAHESDSDRSLFEVVEDERVGGSAFVLFDDNEEKFQNEVRGEFVYKHAQDHTTCTNFMSHTHFVCLGV